MKNTRRLWDRRSPSTAASFLVADRSVGAVEGSPQPVIVVVEFESVEAARRWYDSPENTAVKGLRTSTTDGVAGHRRCVCNARRLEFPTDDFSITNGLIR